MLRFEKSIDDRRLIGRVIVGKLPALSPGGSQDIQAGKSRGPGRIPQRGSLHSLA
jgi:hypothetical protein